MATTLQYRIKSSPKLAESAIPPHLTTLSVSWLNKQFKAVAIHRGIIEGSWENPAELEGASHFEGLLREAVEKTAYRGQTVSLVLGHQRLVQQLVDLPPVKGQSLAKLIQRQAQQQKFFPTEAAYTWQNCPAPKGTQRIILHLFPKILLNQLIQAARKLSLHLTAVIPPSAVLHQQITALPSDKQGDEVELIAAESAGSTTVVLARVQGDILLARTLPGTWNEEPERFALDLNRTILYASQQYGLAPKKGLWVFGKGAKEQAAVLGHQLGMPVNLSPVDDTPLYWATEAAKLRPGVTPNFISPQLQRAPQRRIFARVVAAGVFLIFLASLATSGFLVFQARAERAMAKGLAAEEQHLQQQHQKLQRRNAELMRQKSFVDLVITDRSLPVPFAFLAYLGEAVPPDLVLTNLVVKQETNVWKVQLAGVSQIGPRPTNAPPVAYSIEQFKQRLEGRPFYLSIDPDTKKQSGPEPAPPPKQAETRGSVMDWLKGLRNVPPTNTAPDQTWFSFEGRMRHE